jgi:hypothetical protein
MGISLPVVEEALQSLSPMELILASRVQLQQQLLTHRRPAMVQEL